MPAGQWTKGLLTRNENVIASLKWQMLLLYAWIILMQLPYLVGTWFVHSAVEH